MLLSTGFNTASQGTIQQSMFLPALTLPGSLKAFHCLLFPIIEFIKLSLLFLYFMYLNSICQYKIEILQQNCLIHVGHLHFHYDHNQYNTVISLKS